jgi:N-acetylglucosamine-6-sulfatase
MRGGRSHRAGLGLAAICVAITAWAAPPAQAAGKCGEKCRAHKQKLAQLRQKNKKQTRPNVIVIDTDDMNAADIAAMRSTLSLLGAKGTTFRNSYVSYPLCCPSRATFLTGQYAHNHGVLTDLRFDDLRGGNTLAVWLKRAKYRTAMVGKYLNGYGRVFPRQVPPGWSQWFGLTAGTEQRRYGFKLNENRRIRKYPRAPQNYVDYVLNSKVNALIKQWAISPRPFFLYYNPNNPHGESQTPFWSTRDPEPAPQYLGAFGDLKAPRTPNFDEADVSDKPSVVAGIPRLDDATLADIDRRYVGRLESLLSVDDEVKRIVGQVRKWGDKRNTFFIFTSDNGLELGAHRIEFKDFLYEEAERVPLIIRGPGFPAGATRDQLVANVDLAPTILQLTQVQPGLPQDGVPLLPLARDPGLGANRTLLFESFDIGTFGVRQGPWKYNRWENGDEELYNLDTDPYELNNLLHGPGRGTYNGIRDQLSDALAHLRSCVGSSCY